MFRQQKLFVPVVGVLFSLAAWGQAPVTFKSAATYAVGTNPVAATEADFNGDGKLDFAVINSQSQDVSILLGNGDGTLQTAQNFNVGENNPISIALGDFNADGKVDLAVFMSGNPGTSSAEVRVLLGNGDGTFQVPRVTTLDASAIEIAAGDFNSDKKTDLVVSNGVGGGLLVGNGDGTFQAPSTVATGVLGLFATADFNEDGKLDLAVGVPSGVQILLGQGNGTFVSGKTTRVTNDFVQSVMTADFNQDGSLDLIVDSFHFAGRTTPLMNFSVLLGQGDGTFGTEQILATGGRSCSVLICTGSALADLLTADFDGDGKMDIADRSTRFFPFPPRTLLEIRLGNGDGTFAPNNAAHDPTLVLSDPGTLLLAQDLNGDKLSDLIVREPTSSGTTPTAIQVLLNTTSTFSMSASAMALTATAGQQVTDTLSFTGHNGFSSAIQLACQVIGPVPLPTCSLSPADIPAGANSPASTLTLNVPANAAGVTTPTKWDLHPLYALALPLAFLGFSCPRKRMKISRRWLLMASLAAAFAFNGCGGGGNNLDNQSVHHTQSYAVVVTASSSSITRAVQLALTVQ